MPEGDPQTSRLVEPTLPSEARASAPTEKLGAGPIEDTVKRRGDPGLEGLKRGATVGRYLVIDLVGEGGMGSVYRAYDPDLGRPVALKLIKPTGEATEEARSRLQREAQAMARLSHPHVVPVYDTGTHGGRLFVAMELVEGQDLAKWLGGSRSRREILDVFLAAGEGLRAAHAAGLVHRDFKPENVLFGDDGRVRVTDFGLAHLDDRHLERTEPTVHAVPHATLAGTISGTPAYMSPEQMLGEPTDARTDQFSFCVSLWEALTGHPPFGRGSFAALREAVVLGRPAAPQRALPGRLHRALLKGLSRRREDRFPSMDALLAELRRDPARRARQAVLPALSLAVLAAVAGVVGWRAREERLACTRDTAGLLERIWTGRRAGVQRSLATVASLPGADVVAELDGALARWTGLRRAACESAKAGDASAALQRDCLDRYALEADVLVGALERPAELGDTGLGLVDSLGGPERCGGLVKRTFAPVSRDEDLLREQSQVRLLCELGKAEEALGRARTLSAQARARGALDVASGFEELSGRALLQLGDATEAALAVFRQAVRDADASGSDQDSLFTRLALAEVLNLHYLRPKEALEVSRDAEAWLTRLGSPPMYQQRQVRNRAQILLHLKRYEEAVDDLRLSARLAAEIGAPLSEQGSALADLAAGLGLQGRYAEAAGVLERAIEALGRSRWTSANEQVVSRMNLGAIRAGQGRTAEALALMDEARALAEKLGALEQYRVWIDSLRGRALVDLGALDEAARVLAAGAAAPLDTDRVSVAASLAALARVHAGQGRAAQALEAAEKALAADPGTGVALTAYLDFSLAQALRAQGKDLARADKAARKALAGYAGPEDGFRRQQVEAWLAAGAGLGKP